MSVHMVSNIDVKDFGAEQLRVGDLNGDGAPDLLFIQSVFPTREITCLTATTIRGDVLWQTGKPDANNGMIYSDLAVQVYDWDGDGKTEVLYVRQAVYAEPLNAYGVRERAKRYEGNATMVVLDGMTGREKDAFAIPAPADDSFLFADLTGRGRRCDLVVKDRYWNMWGVSHEGRELWHWGGSPGHFPAIADVDGDGMDEVFVGFALVDQDGKVLFEHEPGGHHQDAATIVQLADGTWRLLFGNGGAHCLAADGRPLWHHPLGEAQHVVAGRYRLDSEVQFAVIDRGQRTDHGISTLYLYDLDGREIWRKVQPPGGWAAACFQIDWMGGGEPQCLLVYARGPKDAIAIYDGQGNIVDAFDPQFAPGRSEEDRHPGKNCYCIRADVWGDSRQEVIAFGARCACIFANGRLLEIPTLYNQTLYPGM